MQTKLTLRLDEELIKKAKAYARQTGRPISQLVADYFSILGATTGQKRDLPPKVKRLRGIRRGKDVDVDGNDYKRHLKGKYL